MKHGTQINRVGWLIGRDSACIGQRRVDHVLHLVQRRDHPFAGFFVVHHLGTQTKRGDRRAQVMTKRMLRELAMRRGVSYRDMLARAEANGLELPDE